MQDAPPRPTGLPASGSFSVVSRDRIIGTAWVSPHLPKLALLDLDDACLELRDIDRGNVAFRDFVTERYLSAHSAAALTLDATSVGPDETFRLLPVALAHPAMTAVDALFGGAGDLAPAERLCRLAGAGPEMHRLAAAFVYVTDTETLRSLLPELRDLPGYAAIFPDIRRRLTAAKPPFPPMLRNTLAAGMAKHGWRIGEHSYGLPRVIEPTLGKLTIGKYCSFHEVTIILGNHATRCATSYPFAALAKYWPTAQMADGLEDHVARDVVIGHDVWMGAGALVLPGTRIGDGAVIGAQAVARGTIPPYAVVTGNPGRVSHYRFNKRIIARLCQVAWWDWPDETVDRFIPLLLAGEVERFLDAAEGNTGPYSGLPGRLAKFSQWFK